MDLCKTSAFSIENVLKTVKLIEINELKITNEIVSGYNPDKSAFVLSPHTITEDVGTMAINRVDTYLSRFDLVKDRDDFSIKVTVDGDGEDKITNQLEFKAKGIKLQYRCCLPKMIQVPTVVKDNEQYEISLDSELVSLINKASGATDAQKIELSCRNGELSYNLVDLSNDVVSIDSDTNVTLLEDGNHNNFTFSYALKIFNQLMKSTTEKNFVIGSKGLLKVKVNGLDFYMLPRT